LLYSSKAVALAKKTGARLHIFHLSTAKEMDLFTNKIPLEQKKNCRSLYTPFMVYQ
jgi:dihydroorotase